MSEISFLDECVAVLRRTPDTLDAWLRDLPEVWLEATEGPGTWSPYAVLGHLIHGERTDWLARLEIILQYGVARPFDPFDREAQFRDGQKRPMSELLDEFRGLRARNLERLAELAVGPAQFGLEGQHPVLGRVTVRELLATWTAHDLAHVVQISRTMAKRLRADVGPFAEFLSVMREAERGGD